MKFADQTGITELITLTKTALKPLEAFKNSVTDVNGIVKSNGSGGFSAAAAGTDYAAASHTHSYLPLSGGTLTGDLTVGSASVRKNGYIEGTWLKTTATTSKAGNFATIDGDGWVYYRTPAETLSDIDAAAANHTHTKANITDFPSSMTPTVHKDTHKTGGSDALAPADIGAAAATHNHSASNITSGTLPIARGGTGKTTAADALTSLGAQAKVKTLTLSLTVAGWSATSKTQTRAAGGVTASNVVIVSPAATSQDAYSSAGVKCTGQGASSLTFTCDTVPTEALSVNVVIL